MRNIHAAELQAVSISLVMWHKVIVVEKSYPEHCRVDTDTQEEDTDKAHHLVERNKTDRGARLATVYCSCLKKFRFALHFCVPHWTRAHLNTNVVVLFFCQVNKDGEEGKDGVRAEESALGPDYCCREETEDNCQQSVETLPEHTLPVPL